MVAVSEYRLRSDKQALTNVKLDHYTYEFTATESSKGKTLLHIDKNETYKTLKFINPIELNQLLQNLLGWKIKHISRMYI